MSYRKLLYSLLITIYFLLITKKTIKLLPRITSLNFKPLYFEVLVIVLDVKITSVQ